MTGVVRNSYPYGLAGSDLLGYVPGFFLAGLLRNELQRVDLRWFAIVVLAAISGVTMFAAGWGLHLNRNRYQVATFDEVAVLGACWTLATITAVAANLLVFSPRVPTSIVALGAMLAGIWMLGARFVWRLMRRAEARPEAEGRIRVLVFGAGDGGTQVVKSMLGDQKSRYVPVGLLDDDPKKQNRVVEGVRVLGTINDIRSLKSTADMLLIAIPSASSALIEKLDDEARGTKLDVMVLPSTSELAAGDRPISAIQVTSAAATAGETTVAASRHFTQEAKFLGPGSVDKSSRRRDFCDDELEGSGGETEVN